MEPENAEQVWSIYPMKINEALSRQGVAYSGPREKDKRYCDNCKKLKLNHTPDQTMNCIRAIYLKA